MKHGEWFWVLALALLLLFGYGLVPAPGARAPLDSFSEDSAGKKAFFLLTQGLLPNVGRSSGSLIPTDENADTLVMLGPARYPDRAQWQTLYDWVSSGRALVFAARWQDPAVNLEPFGIEVVPSLGDEESTDDASQEDSPGGVETDLVQGSIAWQSSGWVQTDAADASVELSVDGSPQVVWRPIGDGAIVVVASDYIFTNRSLTIESHGLLAFRILESASPQGPVYFDEEMNSAGAPRVVGVLFEKPFRVLTLQLLIVTLLFMWMASRRFGALRHISSARRRSLVEHAEALGSLHFQVGSGAQLLSSYLEFFRKDLGVRVAGRDRSLELDRASSRHDDSDAVLLDQAVRASKNPHLDRGRVAHLLKRLAQLRQKLGVL